jgi:hypothetical protein
MNIHANALGSIDFLPTTARIQETPVLSPGTGFECIISSWKGFEKNEEFNKYGVLQLLGKEGDVVGL